MPKPLRKVRLDDVRRRALHLEAEAAALGRVKRRRGLPAAREGLRCRVTVYLSAAPLRLPLEFFVAHRNTRRCETVSIMPKPQHGLANALQVFGGWGMTLLCATDHVLYSFLQIHVTNKRLHGLRPCAPASQASRHSDVC